MPLNERRFFSPTTKHVRRRFFPRHVRHVEVIRRRRRRRTVAPLARSFDRIMTSRTDHCLNTSFSFLNEQNFPVSKRFRPSVHCQHVDKGTDESCAADGFMECVHCERICCLKHITEHQNELKTIRDQFVQEANDIYLSLTEMQSSDTREELRSALDLWKKRMFKRSNETILDFSVNEF